MTIRNCIDTSNDHRFHEIVPMRVLSSFKRCFNSSNIFFHTNFVWLWVAPIWIADCFGRMCFILLLLFLFCLFLYGFIFACCFMSMPSHLFLRLPMMWMVSSGGLAMVMDRTACELGLSLVI